MMLASDGVRIAVNAPSFDREHYHPHQFDRFKHYYQHPSMDFSLTKTDRISDCDLQSDKFNSNRDAQTLLGKSSIEQTGRNSRRKQLAPRSRLVRQCDLCEFSSSNTNELQNHMKIEHGHDEVFVCEICRFYSFSSSEYHSHLQSHSDSLKILNPSSSSSPTMMNQSSEHCSTMEIENDIDEDENDGHRLNIDESREQNTTIDEHDEQSSDDEQNPSIDLHKKLNLSVTSSHSNPTQATSSIAPDRKRPYNVSVDPARYRRVPDPDDASAVKYACSLCGNLYKWRKSLNKHWKEKHNDENPPPLDAPVTIRPSKSSQAKVLHSISTDMLPLTTKMSGNSSTSNSTTSSTNSTNGHHPAFPFNPYAWLKLASSMAMPPNNTFDSSSMTNGPLDLRIKSNEPVVEEQHQESEDDEGRESSDDASSSSPQNSYGQKMFVCSVCEQRFLSVETINEHFLKNHLNELENEIAGKSPPRNTNVAQQNEEWNLSDPSNPLKCIKCDFVGRWPTELQKHAASHSTSRPFKCLVCSLTYKWRWDLAKHWDRAHACSGKGVNLINPYKKRDRDQARSMMDLPLNPSSKVKTTHNVDRQSICSSTSNEQTRKVQRANSEDEQSEHSILSDNEEDVRPSMKRLKQDNEKNPFALPTSLTSATGPVPTGNVGTFPSPMYFPPPFFPHHPMFQSFLNPSLLLQPKMPYPGRLPNLPINPSLDFLKQASAFVQQSASPNSSRSSSSSSPRPSSPLQQQQQQQQQQRMQAVAAMMAAAQGNHHLRNQPAPTTQQPTKRVEKEERNFQCRWCDYRGRWRSELIQHMRCHHARDKPYHCSACPYASSWKWDVQKHVKKQHAHNTARIVELPDKYLFQTTLKAKYEGTDDRSLAPAPLTEEDYSYFGADVQEKLLSMKYTRDRTLSCQQCPFAANSMAELRRHLIVHSTESPYHCFNCNYKSKWKCDVKKHMRICNHHGPVLVGRKAMAKVMESLGLVVNSSQNRATSSEQSIEEKPMQEDNDDDDEDEIIVDENQPDEEEEQPAQEEVEEEIEEEEEEEKQKPISSNGRTTNNHLRCRQCEYEADDLSDLLLHRKAHASMKNKSDSDRKHNSDIENDDQEQIHLVDPSNKDNEQIFNYELQWLENNPAIRPFTTVQEKTLSILYQCSKCHYQVNNHHQHFLNHLDHHHPEILDDQI